MPKAFAVPLNKNAAASEKRKLWERERKKKRDLKQALVQLRLYQAKERTRAALAKNDKLLLRLQQQKLKLVERQLRALQQKQQLQEKYYRLDSTAALEQLQVT